jgi:hypothetical protein
MSFAEARRIQDFPDETSADQNLEIGAAALQPVCTRFCGGMGKAARLIVAPAARSGDVPAFKD